MKAAERFRVGDLLVDARSGSVSRGGDPIPLPPLTFSLLLALVRRAPDTVRREELLEAVWPGEFVSDAALSQRVLLLRHGLGEAPGEPSRYVASSRGWGYRMVAPVERLDGTDAPVREIAVLPFANLSGRPEDEHFSDGVTEALITRLSQVRAFRVTSCTSSMCFKRSGKPLPVIAGELGVQAVVEGGVLREGGRVWISAQLVHAGTDRHLWAEKFEGSAQDVFALLNQAAERVANAVHIVLTQAEHRRLAERRAVAPEAHEAYLRGRYHTERWTPEDLDRAAEWFEEAARRDAGFAEPWAGLSYVSVLRASAFGGDLSADQQRALTSRGRAAVDRALALDPLAAEAHANDSLVSLLHDWDWDAAERSVTRALDLEPSCALAHFQRAMLAAATLDRNTAYRETAASIALDPLNMTIRIEHAEYAFWLRDFDRAVALARQALEFEPAFARAHLLIARIQERRGEIPAAIDSYEKAGMLGDGAGAEARAAFTDSGAAGFHRWALQAGLSAQGGRPVRPGEQAAPRAWFRARLNARLGRLDEALDCLDQAFAEHDCLLTLLRAAEWWDPLRDHPRFVELVRRVGIPDRS